MVKIEVARSSETLVSFRITTWHHIPQDHNFNFCLSPTHFTLKMKAARSSETLVPYCITAHKTMT